MPLRPRIVDLTLALDESTVIFVREGYTDPPLLMRPWATVGQDGFRVDAVSLGTQTGTHIDAPSHFVAGGATLDALRPEALWGECFLGELPEFAHAADMRRLLAGWRRPMLPLLRVAPARSGPGECRMSRGALAELCALDAPLTLLAGSVRVEGEQPFAVNRALAEAGRYLVEELDVAAVIDLPRTPGLEIVVMPLRLTGTSGAPCRVMVRWP